MSTIRGPKTLLQPPIGFVLVPGFASIAFSSAIEALRVSNRYLSEKIKYFVASVDGRPCPDTGGIPVGVQGGLELVEDAGTVIVCANVDAENFATADMTSLLRRLAARKVMLGSIDTGAHLLGRAGLLDGYRATLHWEDQPAFHERYPNVMLTENLYEFDRDRFTCAGGTAGIDMILHAVRAVHGAVIAQRVSEHFLVSRMRESNEPQRPDVALRFGAHHPKVVKAIEIMEQRLEEPLQTNRVAAAVGLSARQLLRLFRDQIGTSPARLYLHLRLERARRLLRQSDLSILDTAVACGFESASHFTRAYSKQFGHPPRRERHPATRPKLLVLDPPVRMPTAQPWYELPYQQPPPKL
jgi:transcriptional regulator GlxA family with amidase domain